MVSVYDGSLIFLLTLKYAYTLAILSYYSKHKNLLTVKQNYGSEGLKIPTVLGPESNHLYVSNKAVIQLLKKPTV